MSLVETIKVELPLLKNRPLVLMTAHIVAVMPADEEDTFVVWLSHPLHIPEDLQRREASLAGIGEQLKGVLVVKSPTLKNLVGK